MVVSHFQVLFKVTLGDGTENKNQICANNPGVCSEDVTAPIVSCWITFGSLDRQKFRGVFWRTGMLDRMPSPDFLMQVTSGSAVFRGSLVKKVSLGRKGEDGNASTR